MKLTRKKIELNSKLRSIENEKKEHEILMKKVAEAGVFINKVIYPGTLITVNGLHAKVTEAQHNVMYYKRGNGIVVSHIDN